MSDAQNHTQGLNCEIGSLAITVHAKFSANLGKVVRIIDSYGLMPWPEMKESVHVWQVELASSDSCLHYFYPSKQKLDKVSSGPIPDCYLRRIVPASDQMSLELDEGLPRKAMEPSAL